MKQQTTKTQNSLKTIKAFVGAGVVATALMATAVMAGSATKTMAKPAPIQTPSARQICKNVKLNRHRPAFRHMKFERANFQRANNRFANFGFRHNRHFNAEQARIITKAELLLQGHKHLKVQDVKVLKHARHENFYVISIANRHNKVVRRVVMNGGTGHIYPMRMNFREFSAR